MSMRLPICDFCKHLKSDTDSYKCTAFPEGIPDENIRLKDDGKECAAGIYFEPENPKDWENEFVPKPGGMLEKMGKNII